MKKKIFTVLLCTFMCLGLCGCKSSQNNSEINAYKESVEEFFTNLQVINDEINGIEPDSQDALNELYNEFDKLEEQFTYLASLEAPTKNVPDTFRYIDALADEASTYMVQANEYLKDAYSEDGYNENTLAGAIECYNRANKRVMYIIDLLHGNLPQDDNITYTN